MKVLKAADVRSLITEPVEGTDDLFDFLAALDVTFASKDGENWTCDWTYGGVSHMDCKGGSIGDVWTRLLSDLAAYRVNGSPIIEFAPVTG